MKKIVSFFKCNSKLYFAFAYILLKFLTDYLLILDPPLQHSNDTYKLFAPSKWLINFPALLEKYKNCRGSFPLRNETFPIIFLF